MAIMNSTPVRTDPEFRTMLNKVKAQNLLRNKIVKSRRITKAITNQYKKYPDLLKELMEANLG